jgi:hypothetical protein
MSSLLRITFVVCGALIVQLKGLLRLRTWFGGFVIRALDSAALIMWIEMTVVAELATIKGKRAHSNIIHSAL